MTGLRTDGLEGQMVCVPISSIHLYGKERGSPGPDVVCIKNASKICLKYLCQAQSARESNLPKHLCIFLIFYLFLDRGEGREKH